MATIAFSRTISAAHAARMVEALQAHYGMPGASAAAIQAEWEQRVKADLIGIVKQYEMRKAEKTAAGAVGDIALNGV